MLSREEFKAKFRHKLLNMLAESWAARKAAPSEFGMMMDRHMIEVNGLIGEMYDAMKAKDQLKLAEGTK